MIVSCPMTDKNATEFARVIKPRGTIDLWVDEIWNAAVQRLAGLVNSHVMLILFSGNKTMIEDPFAFAKYKNKFSASMFTRQHIVANKIS